MGGGGEDDTTGGEEGEELLEIFPGTDVDNYYSTMVSTLNLFYLIYAAMAKHVLDKNYKFSSQRNTQ